MFLAGSSARYFGSSNTTDKKHDLGAEGLSPVNWGTKDFSIVRDQHLVENYVLLNN